MIVWILFGLYIVAGLPEDATRVPPRGAGDAAASVPAHRSHPRRTSGRHVRKTLKVVY